MLSVINAQLSQHDLDTNTMVTQIQIRIIRPLIWLLFGSLLVLYQAEAVNTPSGAQAAIKPSNAPAVNKPIEPPAFKPQTAPAVSNPGNAAAALKPQNAPEVIKHGNAAPALKPQNAAAVINPGNAAPALKPENAPAVAKPKNTPPVISPAANKPAFRSVIDPKCLMPMDPGPCRMNLERYYYNKEKKACETFKFGGCRGNDNRFGFRQTCEQACLPQSK